MSQCPTCKRELRTPAPAQGRPVWQPGIYKAIPEGFDELCTSIITQPKCSEEWKKFLGDMMARDGMSEKQWKFFCVITKEVTGNWPKLNPGADQAPFKKAEPQNYPNVDIRKSEAGDLDDMPF